LELVLSANIVANTIDSSITATAIAVDANRVVVSGVPVTVTVDNGGVVTPSGTTTNAQGKLVATIGIGSDTSPRTITVSAVSGTMKQTAQLQVQEGATASSTPTLTMGLSSNSISSASPATVTATLRDAKNEPLAGSSGHLHRSEGPRSHQRCHISDPKRRNRRRGAFSSQFHRSRCR
jgi:hypothetical protein